MEMPIATYDIDYAEDLLAEGELETARVLLEELAAEAGEYADTACIATDARQWFSFATPFERLAYRRVERDPRELTQLEAPFDRLYAALAYVYIQKGEYESARDALKQAVRWNPMNCAHRLNLAEVFRALGNIQEWAALSASVLERATTPQALSRAFANLGQFFLAAEKPLAAEGCRRAAIRACADDPAATALAAHIDQEHPELTGVADAEANGAVEAEGLATGANAEIAVCLLMCATDAAAEDDRNEATRLTLLARDLIGAPACEALIRLIRESDAELEQVAGEARTRGAESDAEGE
ncbi:MAG: tetratricopeptide repeat protein [Coriobacteriaceae bacterium]|nr:tetratricopeptide repeat protein [Coriobacteriaceae bacterium]